MNRNIIFVSGIHGVGKTTFVKRLSNILGKTYYSSSDLIKKQNAALDFPDKKISDIKKNQDTLFEAINNFVKEDSFILDGHFVLLDSKGLPINIPEKTFTNLSPRQLILLTLDVELIHQRLKVRGNIIDPETLNKLQKREVAHAHHISELLNLNIIHLSTESEVEEYLSKLIMKRGSYYE